MAAEIHAAPDTAQRRTARRLAMVLACELDRTNAWRAGVARIIFGRWDDLAPGTQAAALLTLGKLDHRRRVLRGLLADQLEATA